MHNTTGTIQNAPEPLEDTAAAAHAIAYSLDVHDIVAAVRLQLDHDPHMRRQLLIYRCGLPLISIGVAWGAVGLGASPVWLIGAALIALLFFVSTAGATRAGVARVIMKRFKQGSPRGVVGRHDMAMTTQGLVEKTAFNESTHRWDGLDHVVDTGDCLFIYVTPFSAHILPRDNVLEGDYDDFVQALRAHVAVRRVSPGESFRHARAAGQDVKPLQSQPPRMLAALAIGVLVTLLWSGVAGEYIATWLIPGNWPELLWWTTYNLLIALPGTACAAWAAAGRAQRDRETLCRSCGHVLRGLTQPRCSECGEHI